MRSVSFRQLVACITMVAVLFSSVAPFGFCQCVGCHCESSVSRLLPNFPLPDFKVAGGKCCCTLPESLPDEECCGLPQIPCPCLCCDIQKSDRVIPAVLPAKQPNVAPSWHTVSVLPVDFASVSGLSSHFGNHRVLPPPPVPLHVLLCVFLN